jgi:hypothetical protein
MATKRTEYLIVLNMWITGRQFMFRDGDKQISDARLRGLKRRQMRWSRPIYRIKVQYKPGALRYRY